MLTMQKHQTTETVTKLKDGESTGWIKVIKKPTSKTNVVSQASRLVTANPRSNNPIESQSNTLITESQACNLAEPRLSNLVAADPQTSADNNFDSNGLRTRNFVTIKSQQRITKSKPRVTLKQSSLSEFFRLENRI
ncbi:25147_t:CDS:1, partial [Racocetra persica]